MRFGQVQMRLVENADSTGVDNSFSYPHGLSTPAAQVAMIAKRYMHLSGATSKDFGAVSVADRKHAAKNPKAYFYEKPITIEDHQNSRWIAEPLRLLDCCQETDGAVDAAGDRRGYVAGASAGATSRIGEPGARRRACARHRRHRRADLGSHPWADTCKHLFVRGHVYTGQLPSRCRRRFGSNHLQNLAPPLGELAKRMRWARDATVPGPG